MDAVLLQQVPLPVALHQVGVVQVHSALLLQLGDLLGKGSAGRVINNAIHHHISLLLESLHARRQCQ